MKNLNYGHSKGKKEKSQIRTQFGKVYHDKVFHLFYFSTYGPRAMRKEKSRNYICMLLSHARSHLIFTAVCTRQALSVPHLKDELTDAERLIPPLIITWTFLPLGLPVQSLPFIGVSFLLCLAKIQLYIWVPDQMWPSDISFLALLGRINPFL